MRLDLDRKQPTINNYLLNIKQIQILLNICKIIIQLQKIINVYLRNGRKKKNKLKMNN